METLTPTLTPADRFSSIIEGLFADITTRATNPWFPLEPVRRALIKLIWRRLRRMSRRFAAILAQPRAGALPPAAPLAAAPLAAAPLAPAPPSDAGPSPEAAPPPEPARPPEAAPPPQPGTPPEPPTLPQAPMPPETAMRITPNGVCLSAPVPRPPRPREPWRRNGWVVYAVSWFVNVRYFELEEMLADPQTVELVAAAPQLGSVLRPLCRMLGVKPPAWLRLPRRPRPPAPKFPPAPEFLLNAPGAIIHPDGSVWMHMGSSTHWKPGCGLSLEEARKFDPPRRLWPR